MRLILQFDVSDGCTFNCTETFPIVSESPEQAYCDFEDAYKSAVRGGFTVFGHEFDTSCFQFDRGVGAVEYDPPKILTIDEFFNEAEQ